MNRRSHKTTFDRWLDHHLGLLLKVAASFSSDKIDRDDLLQEMTFQMWRSIPNYDGRVRESTWIYRVALYTAIRWSKVESKRRQRTTQLEQPSIVIDQTDSDPRLRWLYEKISELDPIDRSLALLMLDGFSYHEMSDMLGLSESNVGVRISRLKKQLIQKLEQEQNDDS
ncbi:sigma-70 family RNA polymerase sigma factor [Stieleria sp. JC731]|uniref:RNA polymerase sigma factor n=1 Tax=Pirellulaceae TaxID=2691357 RepID=UPI001E50727B|nr:sigma-70 family RNA polymerase sigma factor [Stieleria sp. JC731]MCC9603893.1 sigma-70 family RNA polymerase sigma factor [Stieleria sp. JC731]